jgi:two-component system cell cycle sensor histidine kinase/response regulator CckA
VTDAKLSLEFVRAVLDAQPGVVYVFDLTTGSNVYVNQPWVEDFGYSLAETQATAGNFLASIIHPEDLPAVSRHHTALAVAAHDKPVTIDYRARSKAGEYRWMSSSDRPFTRDAAGRVTQIVGVATDITREKAVEQERAESESRFRAIVQKLPDAVFIANQSGQLVEVNDAACRQLGYTRDEMLQLRLPDFVGAEFRPRIAQRLREDNPSGYIESVHVRKDGSRVPVETVVVAIHLREEPAYLGVARDITERYAAQASARREAELRSAIIDNAVEGICVAEEVIGSSQMSFSIWNHRMTEVTGYSADEISRLGSSQALFPDAEIHARALEHLTRLRQGQALPTEEWTIKRKDGERRTLLVSITGLVDGSGAARVLGVLHDVTDRARLEAQLREAKQLEALGRFAGAIAHDFNNLLTTIMGSSTLLCESGRLAKDDCTLAEDITKAAERGADLTQQLLTFGLRQRVEMRPIDLSTHVEQSLRILRRLPHTAITLDAHLSPGCVVQGDAGMLDQVIINLAVNAYDAMPSGGMLRIVVEPRERNVALCVTDTGQGIPAHALPHVFEPFFTTKPEGRGTGLGLATVYGIVTQHGGTIAVESEAGRGTSFVITLPRVDGAEVRVPPRETPGAVRPLCVLLVEDQTAVRQVTRRMLEHWGHRVLEAADAAEAQRLYAAYGHEVDLLFSDVSLGPGPSGPELAEDLRKRRPDLPVVFTSGFDATRSTLALEAGYDFVQKPFTAADLARVLQRRFAAS